MSGFLFLLVLDWVMRKCVDGKSTGIRWNFINRLEDLEFEDDIALISSKFEDMQKKTNKLEETASKTGLKININKTKTMRINTKINNSIKIKNEETEEVEHFTYLGAQINKILGKNEEIPARIAKAKNSIRDARTPQPTEIFSTP